ncbi:MAG: trypsin-like serine protease [Bdellovibrionota bacterium]
MTTELFAQTDQWEKFNSSLLIEVTRPNGVFTCTGVAVSPKLMMTAAHCLDGDVLKVRVFTQEKYDPKLPALETAGFQIHPDYKPKISAYKNDLAKLHLKEELPANINIHPILKAQTVVGKLYRFGFGARDKTNIRTVITPTFRWINFTDHVLELDDTFSRSGDSGGPIFVKNLDGIFLAGIHSTFSHGPQGRFSFNPMLSAYLPWIFPN